MAAWRIRRWCTESGSSTGPCSITRGRLEKGNCDGREMVKAPGQPEGCHTGGSDFAEDQAGASPVGVRVEAPRLFRLPLQQLEPGAAHLLHPIFRRLAIYVMVAALKGQGVRHGYDPASLERLEDVRDKLLLHVFHELAAPAEIEFAGERRRPFYEIVQQAVDALIHGLRYVVPEAV